ncbi:hypothetical protein F4825DRAFT_125802 [Nemania diffusa]|nr:hypothetical protein F4825DRAFT_125802 [Nemania diffusa]
MAVPSTSQCYQAARRHLRPHYDSIWVPDGLLVSAFERYAATFRTGAARYGSSVPGPMEHRKRMAKRHMGELHFGQSHSAAPIWDFANLVDLTQWKWSPPTSPAARSRQNKNINTTEMRAASGAAPSPLREYSSPRIETTEDLPQLDEIRQPETGILSGVVDQLPSVSWGAHTHPLDVIDVALELLSRDISNGIGATSLFSRFCDSWQQALARELFRGETIGTVLTGIIDGLDAQSADVRSPGEREQLKLLLLEATIEGVSKGRTDQATSFDSAAWNSILCGVSTIQMNNIRTFTKAMACVPEPYLKLVSPGILENLDVFFNGLGRAFKQDTLVRQSNKMAVPLKRLGQPEFRFILDNATQKLLEYAHVEGVDFIHMRFGWLQLLARLPGVEKRYLAQACVALETSLVHQPLLESEVCQLFLAWSNSQAPLKRYANLRKVLYFNGTICYYLLSARLWRTRQFFRARHLSEFLHAIGRETAVTMIARAISNPLRTGPSPLVSIALGMRKPWAALNILCLYDRSRRCKTSFWGSSFGFKALETLTWVPFFDYRKLWRLLKITPRRRYNIRRRRSRLSRLRRLGPGEITKIVAAGIVTGLSPHLSGRKAFSLMMDCYFKLRRHNSRIPRSFLAGLVHNVTRHLVDGQQGVTSRLRYVLYIIRKYLGGEEAYRIGVAMEWRRKFNSTPK